MSRTEDLNTKRLKNLYTADTYNLNEMRDQLLLENFEPFHKLLRSTDFKELTDLTKYKIARKRLKVQFDLQCQNEESVMNNEYHAVITVLDQIFDK